MENAITISSILSDVGSIVTSAISWVGSYVTTITGNPLLLMFALIPVVGLGVGLLKRLFNAN